MVSSGRVLIDDNSLLLLATWFHVSHVCCCNLWHFATFFFFHLSCVCDTKKKQMGNKKREPKHGEILFKA